MDRLKVTILGCGSSGGAPRIGNIWGACDPKNPKNRRRRCSLLIERLSDHGRTTVLIDTSPDMREQLLDANVQALDAVLYTHEHADHVHGLDDLRMLYLSNKQRIPTYATGSARAAISKRFSYVYDAPEGSPYPPILIMRELTSQIVIEGAGGPIEIETFPVKHGGINVQAIKFNNILYTPDINGFFESDPKWVEGLDLWIIDALRDTPHPTHFSLSDALHWINHAQPKQAILTNLHVDLDYNLLEAQLPTHIKPAYDGMIAADVELSDL